MDSDAFARNRIILLVIIVLSLAVASGCSTIKLVADYDERIDTGISALHRKVEAKLVHLESTAPTPNDKVEAYAISQQFYKDVKVDISALRVRADATERNSLTVQMLDKLRANVDRLEAMHNSTDGLTRAEVTGSLRGALNSQFTAILTFELAKKRGDSPDPTKASAPPTPLKGNDGV